MGRAKGGSLRIAAILSIFLMFFTYGYLHAQCHGSLMLPSSFFEFDHLVRLCVHFGDTADIPQGIICCRSIEEGESPIEVPMYAYNLHEGVRWLEFAIVSNDSIAGFTPGSSFHIFHSFSSSSSGLYYYNMKLDTCMPTCGPVLIGYASIVPVTGADPVWVDFAPHQTTSRMISRDGYGNEHYVFSPRHGGYAGQAYLYNCQEPLCEEPNAPVLDFDAELVHGCFVRLTWTAGSGDRTMILYRTDRYPTGYEDGTVVVDIASSPGEHQYFFHTEAPNYMLLYYKAFSLSGLPGGDVPNNSFAECSSADTILTDCQIAVEETSWGAIKKKFE